MRKAVSTLILLPLAIIFVVFAVANRHVVTVSFDPFHSSNPSIGVTLPLFVVLIVVAVLGVIAGGAATWFRQHHWRRAARQNEAEARVAQAQLAELRAAAVRAETKAAADYPPNARSLALTGQDKRGAAL